MDRSKRLRRSGDLARRARLEPKAAEGNPYSTFKRPDPTTAKRLARSRLRSASPKKAAGVARAPKSAARREADPIPAATRRLVWARSGGLCEICGGPLRAGWRSLHHRRPKQAGGSRRPDRHSPSNLLAVCGVSNVSGCHGLTHRFPVNVGQLGHLLGQSIDPASEPVVLWGERRVLLTADGEYAEVEVAQT